jgi:L-ascorbate metabolism protein UlaG (beta-lactamase superfamily)
LLRGRIGPLLARRRPVPTAESVGVVDAVLLSHWHRDHLDLPSLRSLPDGMPVIAPRGTGALVERAGLGTVTEVDAGDEVKLGDVRVTATPADHGGPRTPFSRARSPSLGYVVESTARVYFAGDTALFDEMAELGPVDLALLPVGGWGPTLGPGHMNPEQAAESLTMVRPRIAVPIHWGTIHLVGVGWRRPRWLTEPAAEFASHAERMAPEVDVRILETGESVALTGSEPSAG